jgi:simple sugar transport system permease protein
MSEWLLTLLTVAVSMGTPLLFGTLGGVLSERAGVINLGMEGVMLVGALTAFVVRLETGSMLFAIGAAAFAGGLVTALHGVVCLVLRANQIASGLALALFGAGLSGLLGRELVGKTFDPLSPLALPLLSDIPVLGEVLFQQNALVYLSFACAGLLWAVLFHTSLGLNLRSMGEAPEVCDALGLSVVGHRFGALTVGGMLIGVGGAYFPLVLNPYWVESITAGRGWIAVALVIFALWHPLRAMKGAYLFGLALALELRLQTLGVQVSPYVLETFPYLLTIVVLTIVTVRNARRDVPAMPAALGINFFRGGKT